MLQLHSRSTGSGPAIVLLHGLFGSNENLGGLARAFAGEYRTVGIDLRNHGRSPHGEAMDYATMAGDVAQTMNALEIQRPVVIGHSVGGKVAMELALGYPDGVRGLAVLDIAPIPHARRHDTELRALQRIDLTQIGSRRDADAALQPDIPHPGIRQFLLKNLERGQQGLHWRIPLATIAAAYDQLASAPPSAGPYTGPALFLRGRNSDYVPDTALSEIRRRFPQAQVETIDKVGHWLHVEAEAAVTERIRRFLHRLPAPDTS